MARPTLFAHPKFRRTAHALRIPEPHLCGHLEFLWNVAYQSGNAVIGDATDVEIAAGWVGEPGAFAAALEAHRFLDKTDDGRLAVHDLADHAPDYVANRRRSELERAKEKVCAYCEFVFHSPKAHAKFCSDSCRVMSYRDQQAGQGDDELTEGNDTIRSQLTQLTGVNGTPAPAPAPAPALKKDTARARRPAEPPVTDDDGFTAFWAMYPRREAKAKAQAAWSKLKPDAGTRATIMAALAAQKLSDQWVRDKGKFIPYPATWLNGRRWEDEVAADGEPDRPDGFPAPPPVTFDLLRKLSQHDSISDAELRRMYADYLPGEATP